MYNTIKETYGGGRSEGRVPDIPAPSSRGM